MVISGSCAEGVATLILSLIAKLSLAGIVCFAGWVRHQVVKNHTYYIDLFLRLINVLKKWDHRLRLPLTF